MKSRLTALTATIALTTTGAMAGLYYAFSVSVMPGFNRIDAAQAIPAMQNINREIQNPAFFATFFGAPVASLVTGGLLRNLGHRRASSLCFVATAVYLLGSLAPTVAVNVPMNNDLDASIVPADPAGAARLWEDYSGRWTTWNTVRAVFTTLSLLIIGLAAFTWGRQRPTPAIQRRS